MRAGRHIAAALALLGLAALPVPASAGGSAPVLSITAASAFATASAARSLAVSGTFNFDDLVQFLFPAGLVVWQGTHFVRFDVDGSVREGTAAFAADGIAASEIPALLQSGAPVGSARLVELGASRIVVALPPSFSAGPASAMLYADFDGGQFASNTIAVTLP
ncbi:MAG TPA: hypothetical protein VL049_09465 [Candidatus Dormibacteraeota bacterium]|nr:hypothetical protein [Candidatus Dormibacteraeota bacterium]